jgi:hypothetical protein
VAWRESGLDPDRFWACTLRLYVIEMHVAARRRASDMANMAWAVFAGTRAKDGRELQRVTDSMRGVESGLPVDELPGAMAAATRNLPAMSWAEFRNMRKH